MKQEINQVTEDKENLVGKAIAKKSTKKQSTKKDRELKKFKTVEMVTLLKEFPELKTFVDAMAKIDIKVTKLELRLKKGNKDICPIYKNDGTKGQGFTDSKID